MHESQARVGWSGVCRREPREVNYSQITESFQCRAEGVELNTSEYFSCVCVCVCVHMFVLFGWCL
jgi:hypothetical protein